MKAEKKGVVTLNSKKESVGRCYYCLQFILSNGIGTLFLVHLSCGDGLQNIIEGAVN